MKPIVLITAAALVVSGCEKKSETASTPASPASSSVVSAAPAPSVEGRAIAVAVGDEGFRPSEVTIKKGESASLVFTRTSDATCATEVVFPELKLTKPLPLNKPVAVVLPSGEARTLTFQCGMGMFKSKVVVQ